MKKLYILIATLLIMSGCDRELTHYHRGNWKVSNSTHQSLILKLPANPGATDVTIYPGESVFIGIFKFYPKFEEYPYFSKIYEDWVNNPSALVQVFTTNHQLLRTWSLDEKDQKGKQFFNERSWMRNEVAYQDGEFVSITWAFDILPEDLE